MMSLSLLAGKLKAAHHGRDAVFTGVSTDTRTLAKGDLFVALTGPHFDGHAFLSEAIAAGAAGALLGRALETALPYVEAPDTRRALGTFAAFWRSQFNIPVIAVTGSNGKTTVKEMLAEILAHRGKGCVTRGNLNNDIGVPLTLLRLRADDTYAVVEMGMNHHGEIDYLTRLARPTVALITNAGEAHLAGLGSVEAVARAKGEIFAGLAADGTAVINADDAHQDLWKGLAAPRRILTFGLEHRADVSAEAAPAGDGCTLRLKTPEGVVDVRLPLLGKHNALNALGATAAALAAGASLAEVRAGLEKLKPVPGRLDVRAGINGAHVIDDTYNANPSSLAAGLYVLRDFPGERALVLGDMAELGAAEVDIHRRAGELARKLGIQRLFALGPLSRHAVESFGRGGRHFDSPEMLVDALIDCLHGEMTLLVKGSRVMRMERVVAGITRPNGAGGKH